MVPSGFAQQACSPTPAISPGPWIFVPPADSLITKARRRLDSGEGVLGGSTSMVLMTRCAR